jgi:hypothetical protein
MAELTANRVTSRDAAPAPSGGVCAECGAAIDADDRFCAYCGATRETEVAAAPAATAGDDAQQGKFFRCQNCGAEVRTNPQERSYVCPFCDSTYVVEYAPQASGRLPPEFVIGFGLTPEAALAKYQEWLAGGNWFRPSDLKRAQIAEKLRGVYLPFWSFSMLAQSAWSATIGEHWYRTETYTTRDSQGKMVTRTRTVQETEWWPLSGRHHRYYSGYLVSGSRGLPQAEAERIKPFHLAALKRYDAGYLAGWLCEEYSIARDEAERICREEFLRWEQNNVTAFLPGDTHRGLDVNTQFSQSSEDLILLPVYVLSYRHRDKLYRFLLNGQTGKAAGDKPLSWVKIGLAIGAAVALIATISILIAAS